MDQSWAGLKSIFLQGYKSFHHTDLDFAGPEPKSKAEKKIIKRLWKKKTHPVQLHVWVCQTLTLTKHGAHSSPFSPQSCLVFSCPASFVPFFLQSILGAAPHGSGTAKNRQCQHASSYPSTLSPSTLTRIICIMHFYVMHYICKVPDYNFY